MIVLKLPDVLWSCSMVLCKWLIICTGVTGMLKIPEWLEMNILEINISKRPAIIVIDSTTYLLTISSPDIDKVAMSLYNIILYVVTYIYTR